MLLKSFIFKEVKVLPISWLILVLYLSDVIIILLYLDAKIVGRFRGNILP